MTSAVPTSHIDDSQKLIADAEIDLFVLTPLAGGSLYFKSDDDVTWQSNFYIGLPLMFSEGKQSSDSPPGQSRLTVGQENIDLSLFKPLVHDGLLDGALITRHIVLRDHIISNSNIKQTRVYRVVRVEAYSRSQVRLALSSTSDGTGFTMPHRQYLPPDFPAVLIE